MFRTPGMSGKVFPSFTSFLCSLIKRKLFHLNTTGSLLPSHGLPPFGANITNIAMSEGLCGTSMFGTDRWSVGVNPMTAGTINSNIDELINL